MFRPILAAGLACLAAGPLLAAAHIDAETMTCADYLAMSPEDQTAASEMLGTAAEEMGHGMMGDSGEAMMGEELTAHVTEMCSMDGMAEMTANEAMMEAESE